jgi:hypothetical protein
LSLNDSCLLALRQPILTGRLISLIKIIVFSFAIYYLTKTRVREIFNHKQEVLHNSLSSKA